MKALALLFRDALRRDRIRLGCALLGVVAAAALLTWSVGLAETTHAQCRPLSEAMGKPFDCWVSTGRASAASPKGSGMQSLAHGTPVKMIPEAVVQAVKASPDIATLRTTAVFRCAIDWRPDGRPLQGPGVTAGLAAVRDFPECPYPDGLAQGRWPQAEAAEPECALSPLAFGKEGLAVAPPVGSRVEVVTPTGRVRVRICGYLSERIRPVSGFPTLFASDNLACAAALVDAPGACNLMLIQLKPFRTPDALERLVRSVSPEDDAAQLVTRAALLRQLRSDATNNLLFQLPLLVALACVATVCMLVNALCVGLEQNRLRYARLRALGMSAGQLARLVAGEGGALTLLGGLVGFALGAGCLACFVIPKPAVFPDGLAVGWVTGLSVAGLLLLSLAIALVVPLRRALALPPCAMRLSEGAWHCAHPLRRSLGAVALLLPVLFTLVRFSPSPWVRSAWFLLVGLPAATAGLLLLVKPLLAACEALLARPVGVLLGLRPALIRGLLTRAASRNARMVLTLTAGLGAYFAIHIWGASLTDPFLPSKNLPPAILSFLPNGISPEAYRAWRADANASEAPLAAATRPFSAEQYRLHDDDFAAIEARTGLQPKQNNILLMATEGERGVTVTEMFARQCRLGVGDTFRIQRKELNGTVHTLPLTITAVVRCNWHLFTARAGLRARNGSPFGTLGPVFVGAEVARAWDPDRNDRIRFLWLDTLPPATSVEALYSATDLLELQLQKMAERDPQPYRATSPWAKAPGMARRGPPPGAAPVAFPNAVVHLRDEISRGTLARAAELLGALARIPLWSLAILCTGFISLLAANVRAMAGELRTLHAIGMTFAQMGRFLFAQALLLCVAAIVLSLLLGLTIGWGFTGWTLAWMPFGGLPTTLVLPVGRLVQGGAVLLGAVLLVTPWPIALFLRRLFKRS